MADDSAERIREGRRLIENGGTAFATVLILGFLHGPSANMHILLSGWVLLAVIGLVQIVAARRSRSRRSSDDSRQSDDEAVPRAGHWSERLRPWWTYAGATVLLLAVILPLLLSGRGFEYPDRARLVAYGVVVPLSLLTVTLLVVAYRRQHDRRLSVRDDDRQQPGKAPAGRQ